MIKYRQGPLMRAGFIGMVLAVLAISIAKDGFHTRHPVEAELTAGIMAMPVGGYLLGRRADRRTVTYVIAP